MKYCRMWPVYIADMYNFQHRASDVWTVFMTVDFGCQKFDIPGAAIAWDHAGEQVKKILKKHGGFSGKHKMKTSEQDVYWLPLYFLLYLKKELTLVKQISQKHLHDITSYLQLSPSQGSYT